MIKKIHNKKLKNISYPTYLKLILKIIFFVFLFIIFMNFKPLIIIIVFEILDFFKVFIKQAFPFLPIDFVFIFGVTSAYYYGYIYSIIIFCLGIINRLILNCLEQRHYLKAIRHFPLFFIVFLLSKSNYDFFIISLSILILNYLLKYGLKIARADLDFEKTPFHIINFLLATIAFYIIDMIYFYFPFLK